MNTNIKKFLKILKLEIKLQLTPIKLIIAFIPLINSLASNSDDYGPIPATWQSWSSFFLKLLHILFL